MLIKHIYHNLPTTAYVVLAEFQEASGLGFDGKQHGWMHQVARCPSGKALLTESMQ